MTIEINSGDTESLQRVCLFLDRPVADLATGELDYFPGVDVDTFDTDSPDGMARACEALCDPDGPHCLTVMEARHLIQTTDMVPVVVTEIEGEYLGKSPLDGFLELLHRAASRLA